ncbi:MAG: ferrous iron transporter B, partial [Bacillota bacterium]
MNVREVITAHLYDQACLISRQVCTAKPQQKDLTMRLDDILTSRWLGFPAMLGLLALVFWLTISGANHPSELLANFFAWLKPYIRQTLYYLSAPNWLEQLLIEGVYCTLTWVVSVMLPPMAIFFPLFTLLEDLGYLPRIAFNLDNFFKKAGAHGKQ